MASALLKTAARMAGAAASLLALVEPAGAAESTPALLQDLRNWRTLGSVLHVAAHPDDENTQLITAMARGRGYRAAYLSITRGDGGQNERGPDFAEKLGVLRTQELLAARRHDGGQQFFTRAIDYGYSKSPEEALRIWDHQAVLGDVVRIIRKFRPDVIITRFPIPPGSGGHGQHTASAMLAVEAFKLAADPAAYPEQLKEGLTPWQAKRIGWNGWGNTSPLQGPTIQFDIGGTDPVTGVPFGTIANQSRGMHKTQTLGRVSEQAGSAGPNLQTFQLLDGEAPAKDIMDGVDTTWARVPGGSALIPLIDEVIAKFNAADPAASVPGLLVIREKLRSLGAKSRSVIGAFTSRAIDAPPPPDPHALGPVLDEKIDQLDEIIAAALGLKAEATAPVAEVVPGEKIMVRLTASVQSAVVPVALSYDALPGHGMSQPITSTLLSPGKTMVTTEEEFSLSPDTLLTQPYWLREESSAGLATVTDASLIGQPENPPTIMASFGFKVGTEYMELTDVPVESVVDQLGSRRPLDVIPPVSLGFDTEVLLVAPGASKQVTVDISAARGGAGVLRLEAPAGWKVMPAARDFHLANRGDKTRVTFSVTAPAQAQIGWLAAVAEIDGQRYSHQRQVLRYEHLPPQLLQPPARTKVTALDVQTRGKRVGYLPGAGDSIPESLVQLGYEVVQLAGADLTTAKLTGLDAVVIGVRAFNDREDLAANLPGLFAWVEAGGTVIAQYNRPNGLKATQLGPYPLSIEGPAPRLRVTDETAPVTFLAPDHPVLNVPNKITRADFEGWVQERGTYFPSSWDEARYTAIFAMNDPGEAPLKSSLLIAQHGKGWYAYAGIAFFRQLPAGNPGAHRLFANLVSLGK